jgi:hypothetical protein
VNVLEQQRLRVTKMTLTAIAALIIILTIWQFVQEQLASVRMTQYIGLDQETIQGSNSTDPLGIANQQIEYMESSQGGNIIWYQSSTTLTESAMLLDRALVAQGWQSLPSQQQGLLSFNHPESSTQAASFAYIALTQQVDSCSIVVTLM